MGYVKKKVMSEYHKRVRNKDGYENQCKVCIKQKRTSKK